MPTIPITTISVTGADNADLLVIKTTPQPPFVPGPVASKEENARIEADAETLWLALSRHLPVATMIKLREHFRQMA